MVEIVLGKFVYKYMGNLVRITEATEGVEEVVIKDQLDHVATVEIGELRRISPMAVFQFWERQGVEDGVILCDDFRSAYLYIWDKMVSLGDAEREGTAFVVKTNGESVKFYVMENAIAHYQDSLPALAFLHAYPIISSD